jgi:hypothetical protein
MNENDAELRPTAPSGESGNGRSRDANDTPSDDEAADTQAVSELATDDDGAAFLADLARAMQTTAGAERARISEETDRRRQAHLEQVRARESAEAEELRQTAERDVKAIDAWADGEIERIQAERERRIVTRRDELAGRLEDHRLLVGREVDAVEAAIVAYRGEVDAFFGRLGAETDPVAIAREASQRPAFPALDAIGADDAPAGGVTTPTEATAIDDGEATGASPTDGAAADGDVSSADAGDATDEPAAIADDTETAVADDAPLVGVMDRDAETITSDAEQVTATGDSVAPRSSAALLSAVPTLRPMGSWFRRDSDRSENDA